LNQTKMNTTIEEYLATWDPMGLIARDGAPRDEYDQEAAAVRTGFSPGMTEHELAALIHRVFVEYMEIDPPGFEADCYGRAHQVRQLLLARAGTQWRTPWN
jgi:hypothetical protein